MNQLGQFIINHWQLWLAFILIFLIIFINELYTQKNQAKSVSNSDAIQMINDEDAAIFDLRDAETFRAGHIAHAIRVASDDFSKKSMEKYKTKPLILICARGIQSATLATQLRAQGFMRAMSLSGGIAAWQEANLPLVKGKN